MKTIAMLLICIAACASGPKSAGEQHSLEQRANATLQEMTRSEPRLNSVLQNSYAYAVFPAIGKGGFIVGGAHGDGILYEQGRPTGIVKLNQASIGAQLGGESFAELLILRDPNDVAKLKSGTYTVGAGASAVALTAGAGAETRFNQDAQVFTMSRGGLMADISVSGQSLSFAPLSG